MPLWLPFALLASFLVTMGTGAQSGWKTSADLAREEEERKKRAAQPPVQGTGWLPQPLVPTRGNWPWPGLPDQVTLAGRVFHRTSAKPPPGASALYRDTQGTSKLVVLPTGRFIAA